MVRATIKPQSVAEAKALVRAKAEQVDYLEPLRQHPWTSLGLGLASGFIFYQLVKKDQKITNGIYALGVELARKYL